ncbi:WEB family protein at1g12150 [Phtheirospermum japonicum]|uniref:WEB family protein at1g12150 n=1 Tax=Phtheirospermum japonicum TaxID=374723 RepID=A0A830C309_9LAMI|nr:WEB family protein at1g12150 [Phtheirospermum japonicum]
MGHTVKARKNGTGSPHSPRGDHVGEIDTAAPFQSVKAAVSLFGEVGSTRSRPVAKRSNSDERVLEKETQHHMMLRELDHYKDHLKSAETAKARAKRDLQRANRTLQELTNKLETLGELKQASIKATESAKIRARELEEQKILRAQLGSDAWKVDLEKERERYKSSTGELIACKQELANLKQDLDAALEQKLSVFQKAEDAQHRAQTDQERENELAKEVEALRQSLDELKLAARRAEEEHSRIINEKENLLQARKSAKEEAEKEIKRLKDEYEPAETLQEKLEETTEAVRALQAQVKEIQASDVYALKTTFSELEKSKKAYEEAIIEEKLLRSSINSIKKQLEEVKNERSELEKKTVRAESSVEQMQAELEKKKIELEKLTAEAKNAKREAAESKKKAELLKIEAEATRLAAQEAEEKLRIALVEAEAGKKLANDKIYNYSTSKMGSDRKIILSAEEFESMNKKIEGLKNEADIKVATAMAQVGTITANEKVILEKLEVIVKKNKAIELDIKDAIKKAEMAEAAKSIVECELQKWRQNEQTKKSKAK